MTSAGVYLVAIFAFSICPILHGQVYVNPNAPPPIKEIRPSAVPQLAGFTTQTVYGFLDFTTTIGNTIMVFSPQSAPPPESPKSNAKVVVNVIETKPHAVDTKPKDIQPTKTSSKGDKPKVSSVVQVVAGPPAIAASPKVQIVASKVQVVTSGQKSSSLEKKKNLSKVEIKEEKPFLVKPAPSHVESTPIYSSIVEVHTENDPEPILVVGNNIAEPEYDFLSRQPAAYAEETYRVINLKPGNNKNNQRNRASHDQRNIRTSAAAKDAHPTGLVTKLTGSVVRDGTTTIHETSVIGTYISGKYAQVLQSTSHVHKSNKQKISPSSTLRILKTAAPTAPAVRHHIDASPTTSDSAPQPADLLSGPNLIRASRRPATSSGSFKNRLRNRNNKEESAVESREPQSTPSNPTGHSTTKKSRTRSKSKNRRYSRKSSTPSSVELATVSVYSQSPKPSYSSRRNKNSRKSQTTTTSAPAPATEGYQRRTFKPKVQAAAVEQDQSSSLYKFKLNRTPGRWQYKTSPKPRVTIRKANGDDAASGAVTPPTINSEVITNDIPTANARSDEFDLESSGSINGNVLNDAETGDNAIDKRPPVETINVEISTPADFKDIYYEIATIKTPFTFQVGTVKNTRFITVTSTFEKSFEPEPTAVVSLTEPLTENILAATSHIDKEHNLLDSSIATLPPLYLSSDGETPPLETLTETFSTTQEMLKTHILPIIRDGANASSFTLIQTYHITRLVTATKTLPPMEAYQFVPSKRLKEFNSKLDEAGSELHLELDFGDDNEDDDDDGHPSRQLPPELDLANVGTDFDLFDVDRSKLAEGQKRKKTHKINNDNQNSANLSPDQLQQLAILRLLNPAAAAQIPQVVTTSKPVIVLETVYESHVIPVVNGQSTSYSTISRPVGTVSKTEYEIGTSTLPLPPVNPLFQQQPQFPQPQFPQAQFPQAQFQLTTAPIVTQTVVTQTQSKILKLTFGAKTAYTTLFSTNVVPTLLTTYVTTSVAVQPTAAFPGYYPPPYAPYPFVG